jgi:chromate reductase
MHQLHVIGLAGSLRRASLNRSLLRAAQELAPPDLQIEIRDLDDVPFYNQDVEDTGAPEPVQRLRDLVGRADGLLLATPEYNLGVPAVMKNAVDWLSRPARSSVLNGTPVGIVGASPGLGGTVRGQMQLRQAFVFTNSPVMMQPEILVRQAREKFDSTGRLTDEPTRQILATFLQELVRWIARFPRASGDKGSGGVFTIAPDRGK